MEIDLILKGIKTVKVVINYPKVDGVEIDLILKGIKTLQIGELKILIPSIVEIDLILKGIKTVLSRRFTPINAIAWK